jgi:CBS domain-containing protein
MRQWAVRDVMTTDVVSVREDTPYQKLVEILAERNVSAVPVVDGSQHVAGVVSEADLLHKIEFSGDEKERHLFERRSQRSARAKAHGDLAGELMTAPAVTIEPSASLVAAAKLMDGDHLKRLPVVDDQGRLVGIVSRRDLLKTHLRPDPEILDEVLTDVLRDVMSVNPSSVEVDVADGVVTLRGTLDRRTSAAIVIRLTAGVPGVVDVVDELTWDFDDTKTSEFYRSHPFSTTTKEPQE